jgi:hypothetical protein
LFQPGEGNLDEDKGGGELPSVKQFGGGEDKVAVLLC